MENKKWESGYLPVLRQFNFEKIFSGWNVFHPYVSPDFKGVS